MLLLYALSSIRGFLLISKSINFFLQNGYIYYTNKNQKIKIATMEGKNLNFRSCMDLAFTYMGKPDLYDNLLKNEGNDKFIIRIVLTLDRKMNVDVFRISEIIDPELLDKIYLIDDDHPLVYTYDTDVYILGYLSDAKALFKIIEGSLL